MSKKVPPNFLEAIRYLYSAKVKDNMGVSTDEEKEIFFKQVKNGFKYGILNLENQQSGMTLLTQLTKLLRQFKDFHCLNLYGNNVCDHGLLTVYQNLTANHNITAIDLGSCNLSHQSQQLLYDMVRETGIDSLQLGNHNVVFYSNKFPPEFLAELLNRIRIAKRIKCLGLSGLKLSARKGPKRYSIAGNLAYFLENDDIIKTLNISGCDFNTVDMADLVTNGFLKNSSLQYLAISKCPFDEFTGSAFMNHLHLLKSLTFLDISNCNLDGKAGAFLASSINKGVNIIILNINNNPIGNEGMSQIFEAVENSITITEFYASNTNCNQICAPMIKNLITNNQILTILDISTNHITDPGAHAVAESISQNISLTSLSIASCHISDEGTLEVCQALSTNQELVIINLQDNFITKEYGYKILECLSKNNTLTNINLSSSQVDHFVISAIQDLCNRNIRRKRDVKYAPLKQQLIQLSIQRTKMPEAEAKLKTLKDAKSELEEKNFELDQTTFKTNSDFENKINQLNKSINATHELIVEDQKGMETMNSDWEKAKIGYQVQYKDTLLKTEMLAAENVKLEENLQEKDNANIKENDAERQEIEKIKEELEKIGKLTQEMYDVLKDPEKLQTYEVPEEYMVKENSPFFLVDQIGEESKKEKIETKRSNKSNKSGKSNKTGKSGK
ncbi:Leucine Rich Repeat family protein [Trichomonas vaginalis G3]|uniref:Leucine Rich Repeat family protein n=1 Tax=Trichomonas vaginalis (strain ATCC PRA-98 / G3) TaxID=412133 RepID=A2DRV9_TRIV3|nr:uncharacterized protein TVAGG3_0978570 [Trichomonas vaginalis G3]EAY16906.1 Leucine Rich Repeat family protein [Trichomonas vaginalis G3]KAI5489107.1 interleukin-8 biosynthetic process [Trichomonas vaginalis G3]|eukprot:XP_001329129.1 hypothetical protein [Trichomonas vaginalis G3]